MTRCSIEQRRRKFVKGYELQSLPRNSFHKYGKKLLDIAIKIGLDTAKIASKKVVHKTAEATGKWIKNKIVKKFEKPKSMPDKNSKQVDEILILSKKR